MTRARSPIRRPVQTAPAARQRLQRRGQHHHQRRHRALRHHGHRRGQRQLRGPDLPPFRSRSPRPPRLSPSPTAPAPPPTRPPRSPSQPRTFIAVATATTGDSGAITYAVTSANGTGCSVNGSNGAVSTITSVGTGPCVITATVAANGNYAAGRSTFSITVAKATPTVTTTAKDDVTSSTTTASVGDSVTLTAAMSASDATGDTVEFEYSTNGGTSYTANHELQYQARIGQRRHLHDVRDLPVGTNKLRLSTRGGTNYDSYRGSALTRSPLGRLPAPRLSLTTPRSLPAAPSPSPPPSRPARATRSRAPSAGP